MRSPLLLLDTAPDLRRYLQVNVFITEAHAV